MAGLLPASVYTGSSLLSSQFTSGLADTRSGAAVSAQPLGAHGLPLSAARRIMSQVGATSLAGPAAGHRQGSEQHRLTLAAPSEGIKMHSSQYFWACALGGVLACGPTHTAVAPLDVVKCNMQIDHNKYKNISTGFRITLAEGGAAGLTRGWAPTLIGYCLQGAGKYGLYEVFKYQYSNLVGQETAKNNQTLLFLAASATAEFFADIALCPLEAVKVKVQTSPGWAKGISDGMPKFIAENGVAGLWKGLVPLWGRQIPYTMCKFSVFESTVVFLYNNVIPKPKSECSKLEQVEVSFLAGYLAGIVCAVISQPADNLVSALNNDKSATMGSVIREMGWGQLFTRGLGLRIAMIGTLTGAQWAIYDSFKVYVGLPTTGGH